MFISSFATLFQSFLKLPLQDAAQRIELKGSEEMEKMLRDMVGVDVINDCIFQLK